MQLRTLKVDNFKSLVGFQLDLAKFTCLIGLNGAGKSTVLQFIDFLARQVRGDIKGWLAERAWDRRDLNSRLLAKKNIEFSATMGGGNGLATWDAVFNTSELHCTSEVIQVGTAKLEVQRKRLRISDAVESQSASSNGHERVLDEREIAFSYEGSILSQLREDRLPDALRVFKAFLSNVKSLDLLAPQYLRQRTRAADGTLGLAGERLSSFLHQLGKEKCGRLAQRLKQAYPNLEGVDVKSLQFGWKKLEVHEGFAGRELVTEARHINDGMLRLIAILAELETAHEFLLFDEIENGVNPEVVEFVVDTLVQAPQQVLTTTHSPMILNYLEDEVAKNGVVYLYKTEAGFTSAVRFFAIPSLAEKLKVMGPGEAFVDTNLTQLAKEIARLNGEGR